MRGCHRSNSAVERGYEIIHRSACIPRAGGHRNDDSQCIFDAMVEFAEQCQVPFFDLLALGDVTGYAEHANGLALRIAKHGALQPDPARLSGEEVVGWIHHTVFGVPHPTDVRYLCKGGVNMR
jgi:hypothetical protein